MLNPSDIQIPEEIPEPNTLLDHFSDAFTRWLKVQHDHYVPVRDHHKEVFDGWYRRTTPYNAFLNVDRYLTVSVYVELIEEIIEKATENNTTLVWEASRQRDRLRKDVMEDYTRWRSEDRDGGEINAAVIRARDEAYRGWYQMIGQGINLARTDGLNRWRKYHEAKREGVERNAKGEEMLPINHPDDIPDGMSESEAQEFWSTHYVTEAYLEMVEEVPESERPQRRHE